VLKDAQSKTKRNFWARQCIPVYFFTPYFKSFLVPNVKQFDEWRTEKGRKMQSESSAKWISFTLELSIDTAKSFAAGSTHRRSFIFRFGC